MTCPYSVPLPGLTKIRGCSNRKSYTGIENKEPHLTDCTEQCYNGPFEQCPFYKPLE